MKKELLKRLYSAVKFISERFVSDNLSEYAAYSTLFVILSFVPFVLIVLNIIKGLPVFSGLADRQLSFVSEEVGGLIKQVFSETLEKANGAVLSITTIAALWSASRGLIGVINGLDRIDSAKQTRGFLRLRLSAMLYMILFIASMLTVLLLLVFGRAIFDRLILIFPEIAGYGGLILSLRWAVGFCLLILLFMFIYTALPSRKGKPASKLPGAVFSAAGWLIFSGLYSFYVNDLANYSYVYGSLAAIVLLILWLYICMYILFLGEELNVMLSGNYLKELKDRLLKAPEKHAEGKE